MKTVTRVYDSYTEAKAVVAELERASIISDDISLVANKSVAEGNPDVDSTDATASGAGIGAAVGGGAGLMAGLGLLAIPGLGPVVAAGWLAATAVGALGGAVTGGVVGALTSVGVSEEDAHVYSEAVRRGGTMVTVRTSEANEPTVLAIMDRHLPIDAAARRAEYEREGWTKFDPDAPEYIERPSRHIA